MPQNHKNIGMDRKRIFIREENEEREMHDFLHMEYKETKPPVMASGSWLQEGRRWDGALVAGP